MDAAVTTLGYWLLTTSAVAVGAYLALQAHYLTLDLIVVLPAVLRLWR